MRKRSQVFSMTLLSLILSGVALSSISADDQQSKQPDKSTPISPYVSLGTAKTYLDARSLRTPQTAYPSEATHLALVALEAQSTTLEYLGTNLETDIAETMNALILMDIRASAYADLHCVPGESGAIDVCLKKATRFKEMSLPIVWDLYQGSIEKSDSLTERARRHAGRVLADIFKAVPNKNALLKKLRDVGSDDGLIEYLKGNCEVDVP